MAAVQSCALDWLHVVATHPALDVKDAIQWVTHAFLPVAVWFFAWKARGHHRPQFDDGALWLFAGSWLAVLTKGSHADQFEWAYWIRNVLGSLVAAKLLYWLYYEAQGPTEDDEVSDAEAFTMVCMLFQPSIWLTHEVLYPIHSVVGPVACSALRAVLILPIWTVVVNFASARHFLEHLGDGTQPIQPEREAVSLIWRAEFVLLGFVQLCL